MEVVRTEPEGKYRKEGYFIFCCVKRNSENELHFLHSLGIYGDSPTAVAFEHFIDEKFSINDVLSFDSRKEANYYRKIINEVMPNLPMDIALRVRHPISKVFMPVWLKYGRYMWVYKLIDWLNNKTRKTKTFKYSAE